MQRHKKQEGVFQIGVNNIQTRILTDSWQIHVNPVYMYTGVHLNDFESILCKVS